MALLPLGGIFRIFGLRFDSPEWLIYLLFFGTAVILTIASAMLLFLCGRKRKLLGNHWLNYLSVSGSFFLTVISAIMFLVGFSSGYTWLFAVASPFFPLWYIAEFAITEARNGSSSNLRVIMFACAILPSIVTWLGMVYAKMNRSKTIA